MDTLIADGVYKPDEILYGVKRALKGNASDKIRRLGPKVSLADVLEKLTNDYGDVDSKERIMRKFYSIS